jgi:hypothetical protein
MAFQFDHGDRDTPAPLSAPPSSPQAPLSAPMPLSSQALSRKSNLQIWLDACEAKRVTGERDFDYSLAREDFTNQQSRRARSGLSSGSVRAAR